MLAQIDPSVLPALRIAGTFFLIVNIVGGTYIFRNRHRFFRSRPKRRRGHPGRSQIESRGRYVSVAGFDRTCDDSSDLSLARLIQVRSNCREND